VAHPGTKAEILAALESNSETLAAYFSSIPASAFFAGDSDHWSPGHHLAHLTQTSAAVERGLRSAELPTHEAAQSRSYADVRDTAFRSLTATPKDTLLTMGRRVQIEPGATIGRHRDSVRRRPELPCVPRSKRGTKTRWIAAR
jgi:hypothetical protein